MRQILLNLLSNAIKFAHQGRVTVRFETGEHHVSAIVADTGIGIAAEKLAPLFRDFYQADDGLTRSQDGSGLGLAISKRLALLIGGDLAAASELGRGSEYTFTLPLAEGAPRIRHRDLPVAPALIGWNPVVSWAPSVAT